MYVTIVLVEHLSHTNEPDKAVNVDPATGTHHICDYKHFILSSRLKVQGHRAGVVGPAMAGPIISWTISCNSNGGGASSNTEKHQ